CTSFTTAFSTRVITEYPKESITLRCQSTVNVKFPKVRGVPAVLINLAWLVVGNPVEQIFNSSRKSPVDQGLHSFCLRMQIPIFPKFADNQAVRNVIL